MSQKSFDFKFEGLEELLKEMEKDWPKQFQATTEKAMTKSVNDVVGWARENAPVDTGLLRSSIAGEVRVMAGEVKGVVGSPVRYAADVEEPGPVRNRKTGRRPWLRPAVEEHIKDIYNNFKDAFDKLVKKL